MQIQAKIGGILYDRGGNYPDLELGKEFWKRAWVPGSNYKSLVTVIINSLNKHI